MRRHGGAGVLVVALAVLAGCGGATGTTASAPTAAATTTTHTVPPAGAGTTPPPGTVPATPPSLSPTVPRRVPRSSAGQPANPGDLAVVQQWLTRLRTGHLQAAAASFADGAVVVNATPALVLRNRAARIAFNATFPCGAEAVTASTVKGYLLVTYRLTDRVGSRCDGPGNTAFGAVRVRHGRITEWYRLPDPPQTPAAGPGPVV